MTPAPGYPLFDIHSHNCIRDSDSIKIVNLFTSQIGSYKEHGFFSIGLHPWHINEATLERDMNIVENMAVKSNIVAIGETGLDKLRGARSDLQMLVLMRHSQIAARVKKPLIIHCVGSYQEIILLKKELSSSIPMIIHGFNAKVTVAEELIRQSFYISFGEGIHRESSNAAKVLQITPVRSLFLETDESSSGIHDIYKTAAKLRGCETASMALDIQTNFTKIFPSV